MMALWTDWIHSPCHICMWSKSLSWAINTKLKKKTVNCVHSPGMSCKLQSNWTRKCWTKWHISTLTESNSTHVFAEGEREREKSHQQLFEFHLKFVSHSTYLSKNIYLSHIDPFIHEKCACAAHVFECPKKKMQWLRQLFRWCFPIKLLLAHMKRLIGIQLNGQVQRNVYAWI